MTKGNIINLIKYHAQKNEIGFITEVNNIAKYFYSIGDDDIALYIKGLVSGDNVFVPQIMENESPFIQKIVLNNEPLPLPEKIKNNVLGIINAINSQLGVNKFLFKGSPGTGKTETVKQIARLTDRELFIINTENLIDSLLGKTGKNILMVFEQINELRHPDKAIILLDEMDGIALDRINQKDLREMGRATSTILKCLDNLNEKVILIATTNLFKHIDEALIRRFDSIVDFNQYTKKDLIEIAEIILNFYSQKFKANSTLKYKSVFLKIFSALDDIPFPGNLKNIIRTSLAFSDPSDETDYLRRIYENVNPNEKLDVKNLRLKNFTIREISILAKIPKSQVEKEVKVMDEKK